MTTTQTVMSKNVSKSLDHVDKCSGAHTYIYIYMYIYIIASNNKKYYLKSYRLKASTLNNKHTHTYIYDRGGENVIVNILHSMTLLSISVH